MSLSPLDATKVAHKLAARFAAEPLLEFLKPLRTSLPEAEWFVVGGAVRDVLLDRAGGSPDIDLVVRQVELEDLTAALAPLGTVNLVGRSFGVLKFRPTDAPAGVSVDIAWPRTEMAGGSGGYRDFQVQADPNLAIESDLSRRDFTVNAMAFALADQRLIDPHGGLADLQSGVIRAVGRPTARFQEDWSRLLRGLRFACQLGFQLAEETWTSTVDLASRINERLPSGDYVVPRETVAKEMLKALDADATRAVDLLEQSGLLFLLLPELGRLVGREQSPDHHAEGDVWTHAKLALMRLQSSDFAEFFDGAQPTIETKLALLLHDLGKPDTAEFRDGRWRFFGHEERGATLARAVIGRLKLASPVGIGVDVERVTWLVRHHLFPNMVDLSAVRQTTLARYFLRDASLGDSLLQLAWADASASVHAEGQTDFSNLQALRQRLAAMPHDATGTGWPAPLLGGDEVMTETGLTPGPEIGRLLAELAEAQLGGEVTTAEEARELLRRLTSQ